MMQDNQEFLLLAVIFLAQNKQFMQNVDPILTFLEQHQDSLTLLEKFFTERTSASPQNEATPPTPSKENARAEQEKKQPLASLQKVASEDIFSQISAYFAEKEHS